MDLMTKMENLPVKNRLIDLGAELGEEPFDLALSEIRRYQETLREHRRQIAILLQGHGVHDWQPDPGRVSRVPVSL